MGPFFGGWTQPGYFGSLRWSTVLFFVCVCVCVCLYIRCTKKKVHGSMDWEHLYKVHSIPTWMMCLMFFIRGIPFLLCVEACWSTCCGYDLDFKAIWSFFDVLHIFILQYGSKMYCVVWVVSNLIGFESIWHVEIPLLQPEVNSNLESCFFTKASGWWKMKIRERLLTDRFQTRNWTDLNKNRIQHIPSGKLI